MIWRNKAIAHLWTHFKTLINRQTAFPILKPSSEIDVDLQVEVKVVSNLEFLVIRKHKGIASPLFKARCNE